ncbi:hypothetical protein [Lactobacillus sp. Sy-1]|uniref:hypothetical protein n=1 Tax=Lactobacillus sp. Sy-1 TaxID=2109645 RepID=UPI001C5B19D4|nr:hypothetical protein [Lactobacillus sp. Sy-1]MBW1606260.1 hypothetical protein [Lactobacillus sp. Sy-1]
MNQNQTALTEIKALRDQAQANSETKNYYYEDVSLLIQFLELWANPDEEKQFDQPDQKLIDEYLTALIQKFIPEYKAVLANFDSDQNLQSADLLHLTPKDNMANLNDYVQIEQYVNNQLTPNAIIDDIQNVDQPVADLIHHEELPAYAEKLNWLELFLLINAIAYHHWFNK